MLEKHVKLPQNSVWPFPDLSGVPNASASLFPISSYSAYTDRQGTPNGQRSEAIRRARHIHASMQTPLNQHADPQSALHRLMCSHGHAHATLKSKSSYTSYRCPWPEQLTTCTAPHAQTRASTHAHFQLLLRAGCCFMWHTTCSQTSSTKISEGAAHAHGSAPCCCTHLCPASRSNSP